MAAAPELTLFIGKGGVGKTTIAAACAAYQARRKSVLLLSTDPAHSLADILQMKLGDSPLAVPSPEGGNLRAWQVNARRLFDRFLRRHREPLLALLDRGTLFTRHEIEPLLDESLPGMAEMAALLAIHELMETSDYAHVVVDTAPLGHTQRLFEMPQHFRRLLDFLATAARRDQVLAARFGGRMQPNPLLQAWSQMAAAVQEALSARAKVMLVTTPERFSVNEAMRGAGALARSGVRVSGIVLNRAMWLPSGCPRCERRRRATDRARRVLAANFPGVRIRQARDTGGPVLGAPMLAALGAHVFARGAAPIPPPPGGDAAVRLARTAWPRIATRMALTAGKGGVGKTTVSAALASSQRRQAPSRPVTVVSVDPAPSLDDVFQCDVDDEPRPVGGDRRLRAAELDAVAAYHAWAERMRNSIAGAFAGESGGVHLDLTFERQALSALLDIVPPGVDELFAIFRLPEFAAQGTVIVDLAPTGHALELLAMPDRLLRWTRLLLKTLAAHRRLRIARDAAVEIAALGQKARQFAARLRDRSATQVYVVMLPEALPDRETRRLLAALRSLRLVPQAIFVNRVLLREAVRACQRCRVARRWQMATLAGLKRQLSPGEVYVVRDFPREIAGDAALQAFTRELWRIEL